MMTFSSLPSQASFRQLISRSTSSYLPSFTQPMLTTMSSSSAPFFTASRISKTLHSVVLEPFGKPMTVHTGMRPCRYSAACFTYAGGMHTDAV